MVFNRLVWENTTALGIYSSLSLTSTTSARDVPHHAVRVSQTKENYASVYYNEAVAAFMISKPSEEAPVDLSGYGTIKSIYLTTGTTEAVPFWTEYDDCVEQEYGY